MRKLLLATTYTCLLATLTTACGDDDRSSPQLPPGTITGRERIGWEQRAPNAEELRHYTYVLYVDGTPVQLPNPTCGPLTGSVLAASCSSLLPPLPDGQHTIELATRATIGDTVVESARSAPLVVTVAGSLATGSASATAAATGLWFTEAAPREVEMVVSGLDRPSALVRLPDRRLLIAERGGRVRVAEGSVLIAEPAVLLPEADAANDAPVSLAVAPDFPATRHVYVSYAVVDAGGARAGRVIRYREASGILGEPAVIIDGLPAASAGPRMRIGPDGKLYVATGAFDAAEAADLSAYAGKILRFNLDGTTPDDNPIRSSPVFSFGSGGQSAVDWDSAGGTPWYVESTGAETMLGRSKAGSAGVRVLDLGSIQAAGIAFHDGDALAEWRGSLFIAASAEQCVLRVSGLSASPPTPVVERVLNGLGPVIAVLSAADGLYFATASGITSGAGEPVGAVYRVRDRTTRR